MTVCMKFTVVKLVFLLLQCFGDAVWLFQGSRYRAAYCIYESSFFYSS